MSVYTNKHTTKSQAVLVFVFVFIFSFLVFNFQNVSALDDTSQKILDLRKQIEELTKQAEQYRGNIAQKQKEADSLKRQIDILNNQIKQLETKIVITEKQVTTTKIEIDETSSEILTLDQKITRNKEAITEIIIALDKRDQQDLVATLIKSPQLSNFMNELNNYHNLNDQLTSLLTTLKAEQAELKQQKDTLEIKKDELETLNKKQVNQVASLSGTKSSKSTILTQTRGQEARYQQLLAEVEAKKQKFFQELQSLENDAVKNGAFIIHVTASRVPPRGTKLFRYPYDDYYLTQGYGMTAYARRGAYGGAGHNGIDIVSGAGSPINPIGNGSILASGYNVGFGNWVAVRHDGGLVSVYAHMRAPSGIANGTPVTTDSVIGYEGSTGNSTGSHLHLSLYRDFFTYINPKNGQLYFNYFEGSLNPLDYM